MKSAAALVLLAALAFPAAGVIAGAIGALLALPALRVSGPYLAMVTIAFAFIVLAGQHLRKLVGRKETYYDERE